MADTPDTPTGPVQCAAGCGFFGNEANNNYCSKCFRDLKADSPMAAAERNLSPCTSPVVPVHAATLPQSEAGPAYEPERSRIPASCGNVTNSFQLELPTSALPAVASGGDDGEKAENVSPKKPKKPRCAQCRKKVGMLGFDCKCDKLFCATHRHPDMHQCDFDYKTSGRDRLRRDNQKVEADRVANRI